MKKILKKLKLKYTLFILIGLILGSIGVVATNYLLKTEDIKYDDSKNLQDAIDELYGMAATHCPDGKTCLTSIEATNLQNTYLNECPSGKTCLNGPVKIEAPVYSSTGLLQQGVLFAVYFNPVTNTMCTDYTSSNSNTGTKTGCMKWYVYKREGNNYSLILDHNTTAIIAYNSSNSNASPATIQPEINALTSTHGWNSSLNPRLISADEIASIVGNTSWNSSSATDTNWFYLDSKTKTRTITSQGASVYAWLFDYTSDCTSYGCNTADSSTSGYWTNSKLSGNSAFMWALYCNGYLYRNYANSAYYGLRPVITVSNSILNIN